MSRSKRIVNSIFTENTIRLTEDINQELMDRAGRLLENKKLEIVAEMFDDSEFSTKSIREDIKEHKERTRQSVIESLMETTFDKAAMASRRKFRRKNTRLVKKMNKIVDKMPKQKTTNEEYKKGDVVRVKAGPHKGRLHNVIHVHGNGDLNVTPAGLRAKSIKYRLGAARVKPNEVSPHYTAPDAPKEY